MQRARLPQRRAGAARSTGADTDALFRNAPQLQGQQRNAERDTCVAAEASRSRGCLLQESDTDTNEPLVRASSLKVLSH